MAIDAVVNAALQFLISARDPRGWWRDFNVAGPSDAWVTGFVGSALAAVPNTQALQAARSAWHLLCKRRWWSSGWGYNARVPADADTTTWALRLGQTIGSKLSVRAYRGRSFLARHQRPDGGIATYSLEGPVKHFTRMQKRFNGWCAPHTCVTAAAAGLLRIPARNRLLDYLRQKQCQDGGWAGYWWYDREYTSALAAEALATGGLPADINRVQSAVQWAALRIEQNGAVSSPIEPLGSVFATAWCLRVLALAEDHHSVAEPLKHGVQWLIQCQKPDGSWQPSARLRVPPPDLIDPESYKGWRFNGVGEGSIGTIVLDQQGIFTTATVLEALATVRMRVPVKAIAEARYDAVRQ